ncbi:CpaF family protein [Rhodovibrionaceae bacterium A322]
MFGRKGQGLQPTAPTDALDLLQADDQGTQPTYQVVQPSSGPDRTAERQERTDKAWRLVRERLLAQLDPTVAARMPRDRLRLRIAQFVAETATKERLQLNKAEQEKIASDIFDDMVGIGPIDPLLNDEEITDILVNGPTQIYVERRGILELTDLRFRDESHVLHVAQRIAASVGRRVDESSPMVDARLPDGSRVNVVIRPLALAGACISIRKFASNRASLDVMVKQNNVSAEMAKVLKIAAASRLNILIAGGTGAGKTTMMNAMSYLISPKERIITIEDAAELQLQQPHVVRMETRPRNTEGQGEVSQRDLLRNSLRMRPDRIIIGECRGAEAFDMLQAMNTGHDGSMSTIHANTPRDALIRLENMLYLGEFNLPAIALRRQIVGAINLIVQMERMRDGVRRATRITEIVGMEGDIIVTEDLFRYEYDGEDSEGHLLGRFTCTGVRPRFIDRAKYFGLDKALMEAMRCQE